MGDGGSESRPRRIPVYAIIVTNRQQNPFYAPSGANDDFTVAVIHNGRRKDGSCYGSYTLHGTGNRTETGTGIGTIENSGSLSLSLCNVYWT